MSLMLHLRDSTMSHHKAAESHPFQAAMARGMLSRESFTTYLAQLMRVHASLGSALVSCSEVSIASGARDDRAADARADLAFLGFAPDDVPVLPATADLVRDIENSNPFRLLGMHYVLEGSKNGSRYIARPVRKALGLSGLEGTRYMDPDGDDQKPKWEAFKAWADSLSLGQDQTAEVVAGACAMFDAIRAISDDVAGRTVGA